MTQEDRNLLLKDLCSRLPYNVVIRCTDNDTDYKCFLTTGILNELLHNTEYYDYKPYLRPMSSMTEKEKRKYDILVEEIVYRPGVLTCSSLINFCYEHHLDDLGLIEKGLALEAPEDMYKTS